MLFRLLFLDKCPKYWNYRCFISSFTTIVICPTGERKKWKARWASRTPPSFQFALIHWSVHSCLCLQIALFTYNTMLNCRHMLECLWCRSEARRVTRAQSRLSYNQQLWCHARTLKPPFGGKTRDESIFRASAPDGGARKRAGEISGEKEMGGVWSLDF